MEEVHTSAILGACPCHQLRARESRTEEYSPWIGPVFRTRFHKKLRLTGDSLFPRFSHLALH